MTRYFATRLDGNGGEDFLAGELPISDGELIEALSGTNTLQGKITPEIARLQTQDGDPIFLPWSTAIYAESSGGDILGGGILADLTMQGPDLDLDVVGFTGYLDGMPYTHEWMPIGIDPLAVIRQIWAHVQGQAGGNLGLEIDNDTTPVRLGKPAVAAYTEVKLNGKWQRKDQVRADLIEPDAKSALYEGFDAKATSFKIVSADRFVELARPFDVTVGSETIRVGAFTKQTASGKTWWLCSQLTRGIGSSSPGAHSKGTAVKHAGTETRTVPAVAAEPYVLAEYQTDDLGRVHADLAAQTPFDYTESHWWEGDRIRHRLSFGYPRLGARRTDLRFVVGENVMLTPSVTWDGEDYASEALVLGAGEGRKMIRGHAYRQNTGRLRRVAVIPAKEIGNVETANREASIQLAKRLGLDDVTEITVTGRLPNLGDEIRLLGSGTGWGGDLDLWVRVLSRRRSLATENRATLTVRRADKDAPQ